MRVKFGTTVVTTAGTEVQISNTADRVKKIQFHTRAANTGRMFIGLSDVSATVNGWELEIPSAAPGTARPIARLDLDFGTGSVLLSLFYVDSTVNGEAVDWVAILD